MWIRIQHPVFAFQRELWEWLQVRELVETGDLVVFRWHLEQCLLHHLCDLDLIRLPGLVVAAFQKLLSAL